MTEIIAELYFGIFSVCNQMYKISDRPGFLICNLFYYYVIMFVCTTCKRIFVSKSFTSENKNYNSDVEIKIYRKQRD